MYRSLSKLLQETQANAAKKLGALENAIDDEYTEQDGLAIHTEENRLSQSFNHERTNSSHPSNEGFTLQEFQIW
jgi:hypothetical protein